MILNLIHLACAYVLALPMAIEREKRARSAGLRTFPLVAMASCGFVLTGQAAFAGDADAMARVLYGLMTGIGFVGGGAILKDGGSVRGTATAASIWATGAVGAAVGLGSYDVAIALSVATGCTLFFASRLEGAHGARGRRLAKRRIHVPMRVDVLVLGTGPAGGTIAAKCADAGLTTAIAESREVGGTCALRGCNPKRVLVRAAELKDWVDRGRGALLDESAHAEIDWRGLMRFKREFTEPVPAKTRRSYDEAGIELLRGAPRFLDPKTVSCGGIEIEADHICLATGARPVTPQLPGAEHAITSDGFLELEDLPGALVFVGGGYIAFEFAHVGARAGSSVVVLEREERPLAGFDPDLVDRLVQRSSEAGIELRPFTVVERIERTEDGRRVHVRDEQGETSVLDCGTVILAAGREPSLGGLALDAGEVAYGSDGVEVDRCLRSVSNPRVFAAGDCADHGVPDLTPTANEDARAVVAAITRDAPTEPDYGTVPSAVFSVPPLARVGPLENEARDGDRKIRVLTGDQAGWGSVRKVNETCAAYKVIVEEESDRLLGAHLLGPGAAETINLFALALRARMTATDLKAALMVFPTFASDVRSML